MKVVCLVTNDLNQDQRMHRICTTLSKLVDEVVLVGRVKEKSEELLDMPFRQVRMEVSSRRGAAFYREYNTAAYDLLRKEIPEVVYAVDLDTLMAAGRYVSSSRCKFIYDAHEYYTEVPELHGKWLKKLIWRRIGKSYIPQADLALTVNDSLKDILSVAYNNDFQVVKNVPYLTSSLSTAQKEKIVLYQGVLNKGRGLEQAIAACAEMPWLELWIAGEGDLSVELRDLATAKSKYNNIKFLGWKKPEELRALTQKAWVGINLLESQSLNYKYSLANKFFDYLHAGVPSINMAFPEYEAMNDILPVALNIADLRRETITAALERLTDERLYTTLVSNAEGLRKEFCWQEEEKKLISMVQRIL